MSDEAKLLVALRAAERISLGGIAARYAVSKAARECGVDAEELAFVWLEKLLCCDRAREELKAMQEDGPLRKYKPRRGLKGQASSASHSTGR